MRKFKSGKFKQKINININKHILVAVKCDIALNFSAFDITLGIGGNFKIIFPVPYPIIYNSCYNGFVHELAH